MDEKEQIKRAYEALGLVGLPEEFYLASPFELSGGQKRRAAIAGVIAMKPAVLILDEPTAMLDPDGRADVLRAVHTLNREKGITVILITHYMEEVVYANRVFVMQNGEIKMTGTPKEIFSRVEKVCLENRFCARVVIRRKSIGCNEFLQDILFCHDTV